MDTRNIDLKENIRRLMESSGLGVNALSKKSPGKVATGAISKLLNYPEEANPQLSTIRSLGDAFKIEAWMLLVKDFPFDAMKHKPVRSIHPLTYSVMEAMERESETVKLLILEAVSHTLCKIDGSTSHEIKEAQATYLKKMK